MNSTLTLSLLNYNYAKIKTEVLIECKSSLLGELYGPQIFKHFGAWEVILIDFSSEIIIFLM